MAQLRSTDENSSNPDKALSRLKEENRFTKQKYKTLLFNTPKNPNKVIQNHFSSGKKKIFIFLLYIQGKSSFDQ